MKNETGRKQRARLLQHPCRIDFTKDGVLWDMWAYGKTPDTVIDIWTRVVKLYPEWQFRLVIGGGL